jgi:hypothetical protein
VRFFVGFFSLEYMSEIFFVPFLGWPKRTKKDEKGYKDNKNELNL